MKSKFSLETHIPTLELLATGRQSLSAGELKKSAAALVSLQRGLTGSRVHVGESYMEDKALFSAYLLYYWPVSYMQMSHILRPLYAMLSKRYDRRQRFSILDVGSGPAPASAAVCDALSSVFGAGIQADVTLQDHSPRALSVAKKIFERDFPAISVQTHISHFETAEAGSPGSRYDIIVMCHALNELWKNDENRILKRTEFLHTLSHSLTEGGFLIVCEPALLTTSRDLLNVRDNLVSTGGLQLLAPCVGSSACPALSQGPNVTCHADVSWEPVEPVARLASLAGLDRQSVKMTYLVLSNTNTAADHTITAPCTKQHLDQLRGLVVSEGMLNKSGRIRFVLCDGSKRFTVSAKKGDAVATRLGFFDLHRYDSIIITNPEIRGDASNPSYGIQESTTLTIQ